MQTALVLGGGGVTGGAWLTGALLALELETGWHPADADRIIGTSAGAVIGALLAAGVTPANMAGTETAEPLRDSSWNARRSEIADQLARWDARPGIPTPGLGSWRLAFATARRPTRHALPVVASGWMPRGFLSTEPICALVETHAGRVWPSGGRFRAVAADYRTGRRVVFGRSDAPPAEFPMAVAASCAIPAVYRPVKIDGAEYVDGGICSVSNLDVASGTDAEIVICLNPMSSRGTPDVRASLGQRLLARARVDHGRRLGREAGKLRAEGKQVLLLQPGVDDVVAMGSNVFSGRRHGSIVEQAYATVAAELRRLRAQGVTLPQPDRAGPPEAA